MKSRKYIFIVCALSVIAVLVLTGAIYGRQILNGRSIYANSENAVIYVRALDKEGKLKAAGSGFCISADGKALTATHVLKGADSVNVVLPSGEELVGIAVQLLDDYTDVAVMQLPTREDGYPFIALSEQTAVAGEKVYAIGYPLKTTKVISDGVISNVETYINGIPRTLFSSDIASGMSGGPLISETGRVIGICSATILTMNGFSASPTITQIKDSLHKAEAKEG